MNSLFVRVVFAAIVLTFWACSVNSKRSYISNISLESGKWVLIDLNGEEVVKQNSERPIYLEFNGTDQKVAGFAGCNRLFGAYSNQGSTISFSRVSSTKLICPDYELENNFVASLQRINRYQIDGEKLLLFNQNNLIATLRLLTD
ncbi:META domain-containing protein [Adhaeribacter swui]|uniref:META domain-containing protein n=1 Tax=Adhaeribacter swui TaxID=2086471 RepID=A0A7G7G8K2_9BACT|nr:META domain-containing protein [Adhaeribacter swui]QNF33486.1 META domain-containing protein [Adhaeribacter swui]